MCHNQPSSVGKVTVVTGSGKLDWTRRVLAALLLLASIYLASIRTVCEEKLANTGNQGAIRVCHPLAVTDVPVLAGLFFVLLLLLPDLSEIGIPGFLSLKRQVSQQESKLEEQAVRLVGLQSQVAQAIESRQTVRQTTDTRAAAMNFNIYDVYGALQQAQAKAPGSFAAAHEFSHEAIPAERVQLEVRLIRTWARLEEPIAQAERVRRRIHQDLEAAEARLITLLHEEKNISVELDALLSRDDISAAGLQNARFREAQIRQRRMQAEREYENLAAERTTLEGQPAWDWYQDFRQEIEVVRSARDAVMRGEPIEASKLSAAVRLAEGLLEAWKGRSDSPSKAGEAASD